MARSWGYSVREMNNELAAYARRTWKEAQGTNAARYCGCGVRNCRAVSTHLIRYCYVTGRAGRTSDQIKERCKDHARAFAEKHGLEWPAPKLAGDKRRWSEVLARRTERPGHTDLMVTPEAIDEVLDEELG